MPKLQIDGIEIADIDPALASALFHLKLRSGTGRAGGLPEVKIDPARREVMGDGTWAGVAKVTETRATVTLRFRETAEREVHRLASAF